MQLEDILRTVRTEVPIVTGDNINIPFKVDGTLPTSLTSLLPIFGSDSLKGKKCLNSGGRGIIFQDNDRVYRIKGNDLFGSITILAGLSKKNLIADMNKAANLVIEYVGSSNNKMYLKIRDEFCLTTYNDKPFAFLTKEASENERYASQVLSNEFEFLGFNRPYTTEAIIEYPTIFWNEEPVTSLVFSIPDAQSDIRYEEIRRMFFFYLKFASTEDLKNLRDDFGNFQEKLTTWLGYNSRILALHHLRPTINSHLDQNFALVRLDETSLGLARVDHTSTEINESLSKEYLTFMEEHFLTFANEQTFLLHALELAKQGHEFDTNRYTSYYDRAIKWHQGFTIDEIPGMSDHFKKMRSKFHKGFQGEPEPIDIKEFLTLYETITSIKLDYAWQRKVNPTLNLPGQ